MPPRHSVQTACQRCRQKRAKCNGEQPCQRCEQQGEPCEYKRRQWVSKSDLRAEIGRLRHGMENEVAAAGPHAMDEAVRSSTNGQSVLQGCINDVQSPDTESSGFMPEQDASGASSRSLSGGVLMQSSPMRTSGSAASSSSPLGQTPQKERESSATSPFGKLMFWKSATQSGRSQSGSGGLLGSDTILLPSAPIDSYLSHSQLDTWTRTGWTKAHIRHLLDAVFTWEYLPVGHLYQDEFLHDLDHDSNRFCSSALVYALLAVTSRIINENQDASRLLPSGWFGSRVFYEEAEALLQRSAQVNNLPDIQALGVLSLYHVRCGREEEAQQLANEFLNSITAFRQREPQLGENEPYSRIAASTYCGAVSLSRYACKDQHLHYGNQLLRIGSMLHLATGSLFTVPSNTLDGQLLILGDLSIISQDIGQTSDSSVHNMTATVRSLRQTNADHITLALHQLTELVYNGVSRARLMPRGAQNLIAAIYTPCLDWYEKFLGRMQNEGQRTPYTIFVHIYYHFCLLCIFEVAPDEGPEISTVHPGQISAQAAHSILALAQSYEDIFTLRRVPALMPYFVCIAGLYGLGLNKGGAKLQPVRLRQTKRLQPEVNREGDAATCSQGGAHRGVSDIPSRVEISGAAHARLLLAKMATTNPATRAAEELLFERT